MSAESLDRGNGYIGDATLNGKPSRRTLLRHDEITAGGELRFTMQAQPDREWPGVDVARPYSMSVQ